MISSITHRFIITAAALALGACASSRSFDNSFSDMTANAELKTVLLTDRSHDYSDVDLTIYEGRLMLTGAVRSDAGHKKLIENVWKADGITQVIDEVLVDDKTSFGQGFEDSRIDQVLHAKLLADGDITSSDYKFSVSRGVVYLLGSARNQTELNAALEQARTIAGVEKVVSHVALRN